MRAAMVISLAILVKIFTRLASCVPLRSRMFSHLLCPAILLSVLEVLYLFSLCSNFCHSLDADVQMKFNKSLGHHAIAGLRFDPFRGDRNIRNEEESPS